MEKNVKLGVFLSMYGSMIKDAHVDPYPNFSHIRQTAYLAEYFGLHSVWATDHLLNPKLGETAPALEAWTILSAVAAITKKIKIGHAVLCQAFRSPAVLAKMVATIDDISQGRFIFALGAGNFQREFNAYGLEWDEHQEGIERGAEQIQLLKHLWSEAKVNFQGKYYQISEGIVEPKPIQKPYPPIVWGGTSEASQKVAADHADIWFMKDSTVDQVAANIHSMHKYLNKREIEYGMGIMLIMGESDASAYEKLLGFVGGNEESAQGIANLSLIGSPQSIVKKIKAYGDAGLDYVLLKPAPTISTLVDFREKVLPLL